MMRLRVRQVYEMLAFLVISEDLAFMAPKGNATIMLGTRFRQARGVVDVACT